MSDELNFRLYARGIISHSAKEILIIRKNDQQKIGAGRWMIPGGTIEHGERPETALARELVEEVNFHADKLTQIGIETRILGLTHWLGFLYLAEGDTNLIKNNEPEKHSEIKWVSYLELQNYIYELEFLNLVKRMI